MDSLDEILASLLDLSKLETGGQRVAIGEVDLTDLFAHLAGEYGLVAERKGLSLRFLPPRARLRSDPHLLGRILRNFLSNAVRYTESGGRILVGARRTGAGLLVGVWDTGIGVPPDKLEEIFEEFHRLEAGKSHHQRGMGLGLSIVRSIGRMLNHPLVVRSTFGRGSLFGIVVPLADGTEATAPVDANPVVPTAIARLEGARIIVIDNDPDIRGSLESLLRHWRCQPRVTPSGAAALAAVADDSQPPDLIIADWHLDDGAVGLDAITALRARFATAIPAVVITADYTDEIRDRVQAAGCHLLNKPLRHGKLRSLMAHLLRGR
jgi:CheY-like chemotaxis protein